MEQQEFENFDNLIKSGELPTFEEVEKDYKEKRATIDKKINGENSLIEDVFERTNENINDVEKNIILADEYIKIIKLYDDYINKLVCEKIIESDKRFI